MVSSQERQPKKFLARERALKLPGNILICDPIPSRNWRKSPLLPIFWFSPPTTTVCNPNAHHNHLHSHGLSVISIHFSRMSDTLKILWRQPPRGAIHYFWQLPLKEIGSILGLVMTILFNTFFVMVWNYSIFGSAPVVTRRCFYPSKRPVLKRQCPVRSRPRT